MPLKYALIGCGRIAPNHLKAAINNRLEVAALCDPVQENISRLLKTLEQPLFPAPRQYADHRQMLDTERPQLVAIATESGRHATIALDCINAGCHVIIEKPIALSLTDADEIISRAKQRGVLVCACHQNRFNKAVQRLRQAVEQGRFGRLLYGTAHIRWNRGLDYYRQAPWRGSWEQDGGALMNQCIHNIDLLRWMMGDEIDQVVGMTDRLNHPEIEAEDFGAAIIRFKNGAYGIVEGTTNVYPKNLEETLYIFGERGTVKAGGQSVNLIEHWQFADGLDDPAEVMAACHENPGNVYGFGHTPLYADMIEAIQQNRPPYVDGEAGRRALELVLAIYRSAQEGMPAQLPLGPTATTDFVGRF